MVFGDYCVVARQWHGVAAIYVVQPPRAIPSRDTGSGLVGQPMIYMSCAAPVKILQLHIVTDTMFDIVSPCHQ